MNPWEYFIESLQKIEFNKVTILLVLSLFIALMWVLKRILYKKFGWIEIIAYFVPLIAIILTKVNNHNWGIVIIVYYSIVLAYTITTFIFENMSSRIKASRVNDYLKNAAFDYYYFANAKDRIRDISSSFSHLTGLEIRQLRRLKGIQTLMSELHILKINGKEVTEDVALAFYYDYEKSLSPIKTYKFELEIEENESEIGVYRGVVQSVYNGRILLGRNVYLSKDRNIILENLRTSLQNAIVDIQDIRNQMHAIIALTKGIIMYYDYNTQTYVVTPAFNQYLGINKTEYTVDEFFSLIHPSDIQKYKDMSETINSLQVTRIPLRLLINDQYFDIYEDSIYIEKQRGLLAIIRLKDEPLEESIKESVDNFKETVLENDDLQTLIELKKLAPEDIFDETANILQVNISKKREVLIKEDQQEDDSDE